jgi:HD superfamily phosphohydrolase
MHSSGRVLRSIDSWCHFQGSSVPIREIRDPVHVFIRADDHTQAAIESRPVQRLRHVGQLALASLVYPGASHSRFEHSLGVMELAGRVFDVVTAQDRITDQMRDVLPQLKDQATLQSYWRRALQVAALCHDIGHPPFSHAAQSLFPNGFHHEQMTRELILSDELRGIWASLRPPLDPLDIVKLAVGQKKAKDLAFSTWESVLSEIVVGDAFGVDRMDYLLRDSHHMGVAYGRFDHARLIDSMRILPGPPEGRDSQDLGEPSLGVEAGGLQSAEALLMARYFMYSQVYFHRVRMVLDLHLVDFLSDVLPNESFPMDPQEHLTLTDQRFLAEMGDAAFHEERPGSVHARRILRREYFRVLFEPTHADVTTTLRAGSLVYESAKARFGGDQVKHGRELDRGGEIDFPVLSRDGAIASSLSLSDVLRKLPPVRSEYVFVAPEIRKESEAWLKATKEDTLGRG